MSKKLRIYELAKKYNMPTTDLIELLNKDYNLHLKSPLNAVDDAIVVQLEKKLSKKTSVNKDETKRKENITFKGQVKTKQKTKDENKIKKNKKTIKDKPVKVHEKTQISNKNGKVLEHELDELDQYEEDRKKRIVEKLKTQKFRKAQFKSDDDSRRRKKKKKNTPKVNNKDVDKNVKKTLAEIHSGDKLKKYKKKSHVEEDVEEDKNIIKITELATVAELAKLLHLPPTKVIAKCMELGYMVSMNQRLENSLIELIAEDVGYKVEFLEEYGEDELENLEIRGKDYRHRPPIVTIMGHVDHGKTLLLDYIRKSNVVAGEIGGITQQIGAYSVETSKGVITFIDTPGHESFTAMRARGSQITDIVVLIIAADDGIMPQTVEAISHAKAAEVPIIVAVNKMDLPNAKSKLEDIKNQLSTKYGLVIEEWGGDTMLIPISAKTGYNVDELLDAIILQAELLDLKAYYDVPASGVILESQLDKGYGHVATVLIKNGILKVGDIFIAGINYGKVKTILDVRNKRLKSASPSTPVKIAGFNGRPEAGDQFNVMPDEQKAKQISLKRQQLKREQERKMQEKQISFNNLFDKIQEGKIKTLNLLIKGDTDGATGALEDTFLKMSQDEIKVNVIYKAIGDITENDVMLASASKAIIIGFNVKVISQARELAKREHIEIRTYRIIYDAIDDLKKAMEGMLAPVITEKKIGKAKIQQIFYFSKVGKIAGCKVEEGILTRSKMVKVIRNGNEVFRGKLKTLKHGQEDKNEIKAGMECGLTFDGWSGPEAGDIIECFEIEKKARKLNFKTSSNK